MTTQEVHYEFGLQVNKNDTYNYIGFEPYEIDNYVNRAILQFVKLNYNPNINSKNGFDRSEYSSSKLNTLLIKSPELQPLLTPNLISEGLYELPTFDLGKNINGQNFQYLYFVKGFVRAQKQGCGVKKFDFSIMPYNTDIQSFNKSSWNWNRLLCYQGKSSTVFPNIGNNTDINNTRVSDLMEGNRLGNDKLTSLYFDTNGEYEIESVGITYLKYPNRVFIGGYTPLDLNVDDITKPIHPDLPEIYMSEIIAQAALTAVLDTSNDINAKVVKTQENNSIGSK